MGQNVFETPYILSILVIPLHSQDNLKNIAMVRSRLFYCYLLYFLNWTCVSFVVVVVTYECISLLSILLK